MSIEVKDLINSALKHHQNGDLAEAEKLYCKILELLPQNTDALNLFGLLKLQNNRFDDAIFNLKKAVELNPCVYFLENLGRAYSANSDFLSAIAVYKKALELEPDNFDILFNLALAYKKNGNFEDALLVYESALKLKPESAEVYYNIANIFENLSDTQKALEYYKKAYEFNIDYDGIRYFLSVCHLKLKQFKDGLKYYEYRPSKEFSIRTQEHELGEILKSKPLWAGEPLKDKTIFIYYEAGLGDSILYARYFPVLKQMGAKVLFKPQLCFEEFFKENDLGIEVIDYKKSKEEIDFDYHLPIMSIPYVLQHNCEKDIPLSKGYLKANSGKIAYYKEKYFDNDKFKIGIKWQGNPAYDKNRIIPFEKFYKLFDIPDTKFYSIQKNDGVEELKNLPCCYELEDLGSNFKNFSDTAAAISNLDLVICNDTSVAHLAAAMGKPCWILLPFVSNWRWFDDYSYSPWYKSVRLFKQKELNNWDEVFEKVFDSVNLYIELTEKSKFFS